MTNNQEIISHYEALADLTQQMLAAARQGDWDLLATLESRCSDHVELLKSKDAPAPLPTLAREQKVQIIKRILENDRAIRNLTEPWMAQLSILINSTHNERKLAETYGE